MFAFKKLQSMTKRSSLSKRLNKTSSINDWVDAAKLQKKSNNYYNGSNAQSYNTEYTKMVEKLKPHIFKFVIVGGCSFMVNYVFDLDKKIDNRFDVLTERIDVLDKKIDNRFDVLTERIDVLDKKIDNRFDVLDKKIDNHAKEQREMILAIGEENRKMILAIAEEQRRSRWF